jgi:hypothetical protein
VQAILEARAAHALQRAQCPHPRGTGTAPRLRDVVWAALRPHCAPGRRAFHRRRAGRICGCARKSPSRSRWPCRAVHLRG